MIIRKIFIMRFKRISLEFKSAKTNNMSFRLDFYEILRAIQGMRLNLYTVRYIDSKVQNYIVIIIERNIPILNQY